MHSRRQGEGRGAAARRARREGMSETRRMAFLEALRRTSDVRLAAAEAGTSPQAAYGLRDRDAAFGRAWQDAILGGYEDLELRLLAAARGTATEDGFDPAIALALIRRQDARSKDGARRGPGETVSPAEVQAELLRRIAALARPAP